ncbi:unnamed protein product [Adineta steineri]|uniref:Potassium channel domain-containing protein n=3 Tax=Adineta steineri TaxID=433720 RepID=A0A815A5T9_9BILA|nr:unnamed protein product [Adineta steineri]CAF3655935.1 unnamed protein product [Adineta steineri]
MSKKFNIREWVLSVKYWSLLFIPHIAITLIFLIYVFIGTSIIQEIESEGSENSSIVKNLQKERERLLLKIIEKRQTVDVQQYAKYVYKHIRQYETELMKQYNFEENLTWNFSNSLYFIGTTLTTIGSNEFTPKTNIGKLFSIIYTGFGIPLTLVFLTDLSYLLQELIDYISFIILYIYSSKYFLRIRHFGFVYSLERQLSTLVEENNNYSNIETKLTPIQLILTLFIYILIGTWLVPSKSFFDSIYICFTTIFTINFNRKFNEEKHFFFTTIYLLFGIAIGLLCIKAVKIKIEIYLVNCGNKLLRNLVEFTQQLGYHNINTDDLLANNNMNCYFLKGSNHKRNLRRERSNSDDTLMILRPVGIAEPFRRLSNGIIRTLKHNDNENDKYLDKSVQVSTIIRRCGRCAETTLPILPVRRHSILSSSSSSMGDNSSGGDDDDTLDVPPPPNMDRIRQRRATLVAKTIINQMATQPRSSSTEDMIPPLTLSNHRRTSSNSSLNSVTCSIKVSSSPSPEAHRKQHKHTQEEFSQLSKQIAALLTASDDEN